MSTRLSSRKKNKHPELVTRTNELPRDQLVDLFRLNSMRTIRDIRRGIVNEEDVDKLQNFLQTSFALMLLVKVETFRQAQRNAEIVGFLKGTDSSVILDPKKQAQGVVYPLGSLIKDASDVSIVKTLVEEMSTPELEAAIIVTEALDEYFTTPHYEPNENDAEDKDV